MLKAEALYDKGYELILVSKDKEKLNSILNDKKALDKVLKSPQALALLKMFSGGKNG